MKSVKFIIGSQYFLYFGVLGIVLPYFNLYCYHLGFSGFQIGALSSLRTLTTALFPMIWGAIADKFFVRRPIYIFCSFISTAIWTFFLLTTDFSAMLVIMIFYGIFYAPIVSFLESFSMDLLDKEKTRYGQLRVWGSISFIITVIVVGRAIDILSTEIIVILILAGSMAHAVLSLNIPAAKKNQKSDFSSGVRALLNRRVIIFQVCAFLMLLSHGTYYGFFSIHLDNLGYSSTFIGVAWALASIAEIFVMINSDRIFKRFSFENVLIFSFLAAAIRWVVLFYATSAWLILISQLFHAATYGAFHVASILYIDKLSPDGAKTVGQAVNNAVTYGFGIMAGFLFNGYFFDIIGTSNLFMISGILALCGGLLLCINKMAP